MDQHYTSLAVLFGQEVRLLSEIYARSCAKRIAIVALGVCMLIDRDNSNTFFTRNLPAEDTQRISVEEECCTVLNQDDSCLYGCNICRLSPLNVLLVLEVMLKTNV
jgi:hypothetical protein